MTWYKYTDYLGEGYNLLVACFDTFPVGFMGYGEYGDNEKSVSIEPFMVDSSFQQKRISARMLELFEQKMRDSKYEKILIGHRTDNIAAAKAYEKSGYLLTKVDGLSSYRHKILCF